jgi:hypothetical protein
MTASEEIAKGECRRVEGEEREARIEEWRFRLTPIPE